MWAQFPICHGRMRYIWSMLWKNWYYIFILGNSVLFCTQLSSSCEIKKRLNLRSKRTIKFSLIRWLKPHQNIYEIVAINNLKRIIRTTFMMIIWYKYNKETNSKFKPCCSLNSTLATPVQCYFKEKRSCCSDRIIQHYIDRAFSRVSSL